MRNSKPEVVSNQTLLYAGGAEGARERTVGSGETRLVWSEKTKLFGDSTPPDNNPRTGIFKNIILLE